MFTLTVLAALPYQIGDLATIIPADWKPIVVRVGIVSALILHGAQMRKWGIF